MIASAAPRGRKLQRTSSSQLLRCEPLDRYSTLTRRSQNRLHGAHGARVTPIGRPLQKTPSSGQTHSSIKTGTRCVFRSMAVPTSPNTYKTPNPTRKTSRFTYSQRISTNSVPAEQPWGLCPRRFGDNERHPARSSHWHHRATHLQRHIHAGSNHIHRIPTQRET